MQELFYGREQLYFSELELASIVGQHTNMGQVSADKNTCSHQIAVNNFKTPNKVCIESHCIVNLKLVGIFRWLPNLIMIRAEL